MIQPVVEPCHRSQEDDNSVRIKAECVRVIYQNRIPSLIAVFITSFLPLIIGLQEQTRVVTLISVCILWLYVFVNWELCRWFNRSDLSDEKTTKWGLFFYVEHFALATILSSTFLTYVINGIDGSVEYLILVTLGFSAGSVVAFHQLKWAPPVFLFTAISPQILYHLLQQSKSSYMIAVMLSIILVFMCIVSFEQHKKWIKTLSLSFELEAEKKKADRIARIDLLTGLYNRRAFYEIAPQYLLKSAQYGRPVSIVMLDIDHFKKINDEFGHGAGDRVLTTVADILKKQTRTGDVVSRLGGEEFAILLPETDQDRAFALVEMLREAIGSGTVVERNGTIHVTSSFGIVTSTGEGRSVDDLLNMADWALYDAKDQGRNKTAIFEESGLCQVMKEA